MNGQKSHAPGKPNAGTPDLRQNIMPKLENLRLRSDLLRIIRRQLDCLGFIEVETPVLIPTPAMEEHIDAIPAGGGWLRTSPEFHMKRLLAGGAGAIYQIGPCFRAGEKGDRHNPEFTMLEWYRPQACYLDILDDCRQLLDAALDRLVPASRLDLNERRLRLAAEWEIIPVRQAYRRWAGWDPVSHWNSERFDLDMATVVEPALPKDRPVVLMDYPAGAAALARLKPGSPQVAERWELYCHGIELCNAFSELTDPVEQRQRFDEWASERQRSGRQVYELDEPFLRDLEKGMPPSGGASLGVDRLTMVLTGAGSIDQVRCFLE